MAERITIMLDEDLVKRIREKQAKMIRESTKSVSFSKVINEVLQQGLKK